MYRLEKMAHWLKKKKKEKEKAKMNLNCNQRKLKDPECLMCMLQAMKLLDDSIPKYFEQLFFFQSSKALG